MQCRTFFLGIKGLIRNKEGKILLLLKNPEKIKSLGLSEGTEYWDIPGGRIEEGMTIGKTLRKEIEEETGLTGFENNGLFHACLSNIGEHLILFVYECLASKDLEVKLSAENIKYGWFEKEKAAELLKTNFPPDFIEKLDHLCIA